MSDSSDPAWWRDRDPGWVSSDEADDWELKMLAELEERDPEDSGEVEEQGW